MLSNISYVKIKMNAMDIADEFIKACPHIKLSNNSDTFYEYQNSMESKGYYKQIDPLTIKGRILQFCKENMVHNLTSGLMDNVYNLFKLSCMDNRVDFDGDSYKYLLNLKNCILDIRSGKVRKMEHSPDYYMTRQFNVEYDPEAVASFNIRTLKQILPNEDKYKYFLTLMMYLLIPTYEFQKIWMFYGSGGNGKDTALTTIQAILGDANCASVSSYDIAENRFFLGCLRNKFVNISSEQRAGKLSQDNLKRLSGESTITADIKGKEPITFSSFARLLFLTNHIPQFGEMNDAIKRRYVIMHFDQSFLGNKEDTGLKGKLITESEKSGFLNLLLEQLPNIFEHRDFRTSIRFESPKCVQDETKTAFNHMNNVEEFINETFYYADEAQIKASEVFESYMLFCKNTGVKPLNRNEFYNFIESSIGLEIKAGAGNSRFIQGIVRISDL
ncbi:MAG: phage/plasmid primase, P4 family [Chitinophagales bacterium]